MHPGISRSGSTESLVLSKSFLSKSVFPEREIQEIYNFISVLPFKGRKECVGLPKQFQSGAPDLKKAHISKGMHQVQDLCHFLPQKCGSTA